MSFFKFIHHKPELEERTTRLQKNIEAKTQGLSEKDKVLTACLSGLMAKIAHSDENLDLSEKKAMASSLQAFASLSHDQSQLIIDLASENEKELAGLEDHIYTDQLNEILDENEKFSILKSCFAVAASDGNVDNQESEIIRQITQGLRLTHQHFISARATVIKQLGALKKS